ncbi:flavin reductase family protein [Bacillus canaveralius]|uniref:flavin reductase family protein n=1 Tax=Bacillus canaveralius TaxID=1403243 RepID=UPI000F784FBF|nr:flavin reductase family protein [Bacillus canaveralius]RSK55204.1 flavin reductase family protein [Bacillus canaveralius]
MLSIDPNTLEEKENYKFLTGSIIPRPIAFVTSVSKEGVLNGAPFSYFNIVASSPPLISLSIQRKQGVRKDTARNIIQNREFVVHITDEENVERINITAASLPAAESEISLARLTPAESNKISVPGIKEAKIRFECVLEDFLELGGTKGEPACDLLIGRVVQYHIENDLYEQGRINQDMLAAVSRLAGNDYATIGKVFSIKRPK